MRVFCQDGSVVSWGNRSCGGDSSSVKDQLLEVEEPLDFESILNDIQHSYNIFYYNILNRWIFINDLVAALYNVKILL